MTRNELILLIQYPNCDAKNIKIITELNMWFKLFISKLKYVS